MKNMAERIIVPLDVPGEKEAIALIQSLPEVTFWKVGLELFVSSGPSILAALKVSSKRIFLDLKFHDIPNTMAGACRAAGRYGVDLLTVHASAGGAALKAAQAAALEGAAAAGCAPPRVIAVTLLTSIETRSLQSELQIPLETYDYAQQMALLAQASGLGGAVCSPQEAVKLRAALNAAPDDFWLVCPGVRPLWSQKGDQQRAMTPTQAIHAGADYLVIGRPITQAEDPAAAFLQICEEMAA
jgi:orotidine-5'-phosphate decarboxylase